MIALAFVLSFVLLLITALHVYWGIGGIWPGRDAASCARAVVGFRGVDEMPTPFASFAVAACLGLATLWPLALIGFYFRVLDGPLGAFPYAIRDGRACRRRGAAVALAADRGFRHRRHVVRL